MKARLALLLLSVTLMSATAGDTTKPDLDKEKIAILGAASKYRPEGATTVAVRRVPGKDIAYVCYSIRRGGYDVASAVVMLTKTSKHGWVVETCAL